MPRDADALLVKARAVIPDAAGLLLCDDRAHARASAALLRTTAREKPVPAHQVVRLVVSRV